VKKSDPSRLKSLGTGKLAPSNELELIPFAHCGSQTVVTLNCEEFSCLCPVTGQPDFARLRISYHPRKTIVESKSVKQYLWTYREVGIFHEDVINQIADDFYKALQPEWLVVDGHFNIRGGISIEVSTARGCKKDTG
jgi:7-cyano-7-deazaguanine reductase